jgi:DNA primase
MRLITRGVDNPKREVLPTLPLARRVELLSRVAAHYHRAFLECSEGVGYLTKVRGIRNVELFKSFQIGLATGSIMEILPADRASRAELKAIGVLREDGSEALKDQVIFPLWNAQGAVVSLCGWSIDPKDPDDYRRYLDGADEALWNYQAVKRSSSVVLVASLMDALVAIDRGLTEVIPCVTRDGLTDAEESLLVQCGVKRVAIAFHDEWKEHGDEAVRRLEAKGIQAPVVRLPNGQKLMEYLSGPHADEGAKAFQERVGAALAAVAAKDGGLSAGAAVALPGEVYERTSHGFRLTLHGPRYDVMGVAREATQLKAIVKAQGDPAKGNELRALDLFSARSRDAYARECANLFGVGETIIKADLARIIERIEALHQEAPNASTPKPASPEEIEAATAFLRNPAIFDEVLTDVRTLGIAGEDTNILLCYLATVSRKLEDPLSLLIQSRSAAGKSALQHAILSLTPEEDQIHYTRLTSQALFYQEEASLAHKVLALEEAEGLGEAAYSLRALQPAKKLTVATTAKDPVTGKMRTDHYEVHGPVAVLLTTTSASLDEETASRFMTLTIDESREMTETILATQRHRDTLKGYLAELDRAAVIAKHRTAQRLLEPVVVINPYAEQLVFPSDSLRARRDHKKYLVLIKAVAFLRQKQRPVKTATGGGKSFAYIEVTKDDILLANDLARRVLAHCLDELSAPARKLLVKIDEMVKAHCAEHGVVPSNFAFTRRAIRDATGYTVHQVRVHAKELEDLEYLRAKAGSRGKEFVYELGALGRGQSGLVLADPDTLKEPE